MQHSLTHFFNRKRPRLLYFMRLGRQIPSCEAEIADFVASVLSEWESVRNITPQAPVSRVELTFWYSLYQLENLAELPLAKCSGQPRMAGRLSPYDVMLLDTLAECRELLLHRQPLPQNYYTTRPGDLRTDRDLSNNVIPFARLI